MTSERSPRTSRGLTDKRYWRRVRAAGVWHCFKRRHHTESTPRARYVSLCALRVTLARVNGQKCNRPPPWARCGGCDAAEITRMGADESLPDSPDFNEGQL